MKYVYMSPLNILFPFLTLNRHKEREQVFLTLLNTALPGGRGNGVCLPLEASGKDESVHSFTLYI